MDDMHALDLHPRSTLKISNQQHEDTQGPYVFYDVKFCPFPTTWPIFAIVGARHVLICRPPISDEESVIVLSTLCDRGDVPKSGPDPESLNSCEWNFVEPSQPLVSLSGESGLIKVFDVTAGELFTTLVGHGIGCVNDLATHPQYPYILASASMDSSIRIWDLRRCSDKTRPPCIIICGHGQGHKEGILSISWHGSGRYLISGGFDHAICVWTMPDLSSGSSFWGEIAHPKRSAQSVKVIHYPHFKTSALHDNYVDCVRFYGDWIFSKSSKAAERKQAHEQINEIVLWRIGGFHSKLPIPPPERAPKTKDYLDTRNGFLYTPANVTSPPDEMSNPLYERLLEFFIPNAESFYMRFGLLDASPAHPDLHPTLTFGNHNSKVFFWDLQRLESGHHVAESGAIGNGVTLAKPYGKLEAHLEFKVPEFSTKKFVSRGVGWSADGRWCVVAGQSGDDAVAVLFEREGTSAG